MSLQRVSLTVVHVRADRFHVPQAPFAVAQALFASLVAAVSFQSVHSLGSVIPTRWLNNRGVKSQIIHYFTLWGYFSAIAVLVVATRKATKKL